MRENRQDAEATEETLPREAEFRAEWTGDNTEDSSRAAPEPEADQRPEELYNVPSRAGGADQGTAEDAQKQSREQNRTRLEERNQALRDAAWKEFMQIERRELELRKEGQLGKLLGEPVSGEPPEALRQLAHQDLRQAEAGLVALMSGGKFSYKHLDELLPEDMPARIAAERLRTTWLKERQDGWLVPGRGSL